LALDTTINIHAAKTRFSELVERAHGGEEITIAKAGKPYARLVPLEPPKARPLGFVHAPFDEAFFDPLPEDELAAWE
jgi:prevent-host-death family protein